MKIKIKYLLFLFAILFSVCTDGQNTSFYLGKLNESTNRLQGKLRGEYYYNSLVGNEYFFLHKKWSDATITLIDGDVFENVKVRYLAYGDELISYNENIKSYFFKIDKDIIKQFTIETILNSGNVKHQKFIKLYYDGLTKGDRYFEELYSGTRSLLLYYTIRGTKVRPFKDNSGILQDTEYRMHVTYFMYSPDEGYTKIHKTKRAFRAALPDNKKEIRKLFRKNKLNIFDDASMIQAFKLLEEANIL